MVIVMKSQPRVRSSYAILPILPTISEEWWTVDWDLLCGRDVAPVVLDLGLRMLPAKVSRRPRPESLFAAKSSAESTVFFPLREIFGLTNAKVATRAARRAPSGYTSKARAQQETVTGWDTEQRGLKRQEKPAFGGDSLRSLRGCDDTRLKGSMSNFPPSITSCRFRMNCLRSPCKRGEATFTHQNQKIFSKNFPVVRNYPREYTKFSEEMSDWRPSQTKSAICGIAPRDATFVLDILHTKKGSRSYPGLYRVRV